MLLINIFLFKKLEYINRKLSRPSAITPSALISLDEETTVFGGYINAIQYHIENSGYNIYITFNINTKQIELIVNRPENVAKQDIVLTLKFYTFLSFNKKTLNFVSFRILY
mgnify:CR=1 FL=1